MRSQGLGVRWRGLRSAGGRGRRGSPGLRRVRRLVRACRPEVCRAAGDGSVDRGVYVGVEGGLSWKMSRYLLPDAR